MNGVIGALVFGAIYINEFEIQYFDFKYNCIYYMRRSAFLEVNIYFCWNLVFKFLESFIVGNFYYVMDMKDFVESRDGSKSSFRLFSTFSQLFAWMLGVTQKRLDWISLETKLFCVHFSLCCAVFFVFFILSQDDVSGYNIIALFA